MPAGTVSAVKSIRLNDNIENLQIEQLKVAANII